MLIYFYAFTDIIPLSSSLTTMRSRYFLVGGVDASVVISVSSIIFFG